MYDKIKQSYIFTHYIILSKTDFETKQSLK